MGSYDQLPEDYDGPAPEHAILCNSRWSHKGLRHAHPSVELVRLCYAAAADEAKGMEVWPCSWGMLAYNEDGAYTVECGLPTRYTDQRGSYECAGGHDHVPADLLYERGQAYTDDPLEAEGLARNGVFPLQPNGQAWS